ncbi:transketolase [Arthrobacter sp. NEB 688]|uniref:transketolase n=1 Tax=Arthrobacter sp. NEB 688 TaxID=904039 RepID=UPI001565476F|nr:transketolase [Arthrobacter sp. NEB 688]QKE82903.1 transketolase [Arthrobacter sp. NEB 688]
MTTTTTTAASAVDAQRLEHVRQVAHDIRMGVLEQGEAQGEGYVGQALGIADVLAGLYGDTLRLRPEDPEWEERDLFLLSIGHYALALYSALAAARVIPREELLTYAADGSRLPMSGMKTYTPGMEISGGSLGHGLGQAVGMALGLRLRGQHERRVVNLLSDGELNEGSTWEAAMSAAHWRLGNLVALVDLNGLQADGRTEDVLRLEPQEDRWASFDWRVLRIDGNDLHQVLGALDAATAVAAPEGTPTVILCDTRLAHGVPVLEAKDKLHFLRVAPEEWPVAKDQLTARHEGEQR